MTPHAPPVAPGRLGGVAPTVRHVVPGLDGTSVELIRRLELEITKRLDGILHGEHQGLVPGHGSEPGEARQYQPGDDVRRIDWNVTARTTHPYVRESIADRELETWIVVDRSASLDFGTHTWEKRELALAAAAGVGFLTNRGGNRVGALICEHDTVSVLPARQGRKHILAILSRIQGTQREDTPTRVRSAPTVTTEVLLRRASVAARRRGLVVVISDWLDDPAEWKNACAALALGHQVLCVELIDPRELELPNVGLLTLVDPETGRVREVDTTSKKLRTTYAAAAAEQREAVAATILASGAQHLRLRTDEDWLLSLARFVSKRRSRQSSNVRSTP